MLSIETLDVFLHLLGEVRLNPMDDTFADDAVRVITAKKETMEARQAILEARPVITLEDSEKDPLGPGHPSLINVSPD